MNGGGRMWKMNIGLGGCASSDVLVRFMSGLSVRASIEQPPDHPGTPLTRLFSMIRVMLPLQLVFDRPDFGPLHRKNGVIEAREADGEENGGLAAARRPGFYSRWRGDVHPIARRFIVHRSPEDSVSPPTSSSRHSRKTAPAPILSTVGNFTLTLTCASPFAFLTLFHRFAKKTRASPTPSHYTTAVEDRVRDRCQCGRACSFIRTTTNVMSSSCRREPRQSLANAASSATSSSAVVAAEPLRTLVRRS